MRQRVPRSKLSLGKISPLWIVLIVGVLGANWLFTSFFRDSEQKIAQSQLQAKAVELAEQAVREKIGSAQPVKFHRKADVEVKGSQYVVSSHCITLTRLGEQDQRAWIVTLQVQKDKVTGNTQWQVLSCDIGE